MTHSERGFGGGKCSAAESLRDGCGVEVPCWRNSRRPGSFRTVRWHSAALMHQLAAASSIVPVIRRRCTEKSISNDIRHLTGTSYARRGSAEFTLPLRGIHF